MSARIAMATSNKRIAVADSSEDDVMVVAILGRLAGGRKNRSCGIIILYHLESSWPWAGYLLVHQHG